MIIGRIYKLYIENELDVYIGSTTQNLNQRLSNHKCNYRRYLNGNHGFITSFSLIEKHGVNALKIQLLEELYFNNKIDLINLESNYIKSIEHCINKVIPNRTKKQYIEDTKEKRKQYYQDNKDKVKQYQVDNKDKIKQYIEDNKVNMKELQKKYKENNKEKLKEYSTQYKVNNNEKMKDKRLQYYEDKKYKLKQQNICCCGGKFTTINKAIHIKSKKHQVYIKL